MLRWLLLCVIWGHDWQRTHAERAGVVRVAYRCTRCLKWKVD